MLPSYFLPHDITLITVTETGSDDRYGNATDQEASVAARAYMQPVSGTEDIVNRDTRITRWNVFLQPTESLNGLSKITWEGVTYRVVGEPRRFDTPAGAHHYEVTAESIHG